MKLISLLTDFGTQDCFAGLLKAVILKINPNAETVSLSHNIRPQAVSEAAFILERSFQYFPYGTIHLVVVDPGVGSRRKKLLIETENYSFIGPDNGVLYPALKKEKIKRIIKIENKKYFLQPVSNTFHGRDIFAPAAAYLSLGKDPHSLGKPLGNLDKIKKLDLPEAFMSKNKLKGEIIYIDSFGNLITNISKASFERFTGNSPFQVLIRDKKINKISSNYLQAKQDTPCALFNSFGNLEIAVKKGSAQKALSLNTGETVQVILKNS